MQGRGIGSKLKVGGGGGGGGGGGIFCNQSFHIGL